MNPRALTVLRGAGDLATGVAHRLYRAGFPLVLLERPEPTAVRRSVAFSEAVFAGEWAVEGVNARLCASAAEALAMAEAGARPVPLLIDPEGTALAQLRPVALVDARMAKRNLGTALGDAQVVVGLGPGFTAGADCHAVVETAWGPDLGRVIYSGRAAAHTGIPGDVDGATTERVLRAPGDGIWRARAAIGDLVALGQVVAEVQGEGELLPVTAAIGGVLRGLLRDGAPVRRGQKAGDVDPRGDAALVGRISDKALAVGGGVLEAVSCLLWGRPPGGQGPAWAGQP